LAQVILVNEADEAIGAMEKIEAHQKALLHRAISVFVFNKNGELLLQQRALEKYHSAGLWTNTCCSHPEPGEETLAAAERRLKEEMGFKTPLRHAFTFTYLSDFDNGLTEHEVDHVFTGFYDGSIIPNSEEVAAFKFISMDQLQQLIKNDPQEFTTWFKIAVPLLQEYLATKENLSNEY
jgi:isopentenyl-diphosphate delta-isomerase